MSDSDKQAIENVDAYIAERRMKIDDIDARILELINQRLMLGKEIGAAKAQNGVQVLDQSRELQVMKRLEELNRGPLDDKVVRHIFSVIISASREIQKPQMIAYLGPEATYTHMATLDHFGHSGTYVPQPNIREVFEEVESGSCQYGVVPVENSIEGAVNLTLDLLFESGLKICAEKYQVISHDLLCRSGRLDDVVVVYSHPQAFAQCRGWLRKNLPNAVLKECSSTAHAAQRASEEMGAAAIAGHSASFVYNLKSAASKIEDSNRNVTRFLVIGKDEVSRTGRDKTTFMFVTSHIPGALYKTLQPLAETGTNMVKLESRPTKHKNWRYFFVMDIEGHMDDPKINKAAQKLKDICLFFKCLGSYPAAVEV